MNHVLIKRLRLIKGVDIPEISECLSISHSSYYDIEHGKCGLAAKHISKFCEFYGITPNQYFGLEKITVEIENGDVIFTVK